MKLPFPSLVRPKKIRQHIKRIAVKNSVTQDDDTEAYLKRHLCPNPFQQLQTQPNGDVHLCCPGWLPTPAGSIGAGLLGVWHGRMARKIRASILDGDYRYCSRLDCPEITGRSLIPRDSEAGHKLLADWDVPGDRIPPPREILLSHDLSCNLSCPSCRDHTILASKAKQAELDALVEERIVPILRQVPYVYITGSGDPFASNHFRRIIKRLTKDEFPNLSIKLHSNGQLWDRRAWQELDLSGKVEQAEISIDAACAETYAKVRRGGRFDRLLANLAFIRELRERGEIAYLNFSFVVQSCNYREMPAFAELGAAYAADGVTFQMIRNWGTYDPEAFKRIYIGRSNPDLPHLIEVLKAPELKRPGVDISNVLAHVEKAAAATDLAGLGLQ